MRGCIGRTPTAYATPKRLFCFEILNLFVASPRHISQFWTGRVILHLTAATVVLVQCGNSTFSEEVVRLIVVGKLTRRIIRRPSWHKNNHALPRTGQDDAIGVF
jgi:hypothetical protein